MKRIELSRRTLTVRAIGGLTALAVANKIDSVIAAPQIVALPDEGGEAPWDYWLSEKSAGVVRIASAGILWANPYNTQPWLFRLSDDRIEVLADLNRNLAVLDSLRRELYIGLGCAIENASVAAPSQGLAANVSLRMDAQTNLAAIINLGPSKTAKHLHHDAIALRHTHRGAYRQDRNVERQTLDALMRQVSSADTRLLLIDASTPDGRSHADLINEATETIIATPDLRDGRHIGIRGSIPRTTTDLEEAYRNADAAWVRANHTVSCATAVMFGLIMVRGSPDQSYSAYGSRPALAAPPSGGHGPRVDLEGRRNATNEIESAANSAAYLRALSSHDEILPRVRGIFAKRCPNLDIRHRCGTVSGSGCVMAITNSRISLASANETSGSSAQGQALSGPERPDKRLIS